MRYLISALKRSISASGSSLGSRLSATGRLTEPGNTDVIAPKAVFLLKGRTPGSTGVTSGAENMSVQVQKGAKLDTIRRRAMRAPVVLAAFALIAVMAFPTIGPAGSRASADHAPLQAIFGTVVEVSVPDSITVATNSGLITVSVLGNEVFTGDITAVEDVSEGDRIVGSIHVGTDGTTVADKLLVIPDLTKSITRHILGVILEQQDGAVVIQDRDGDTVTIDVPEGVDVPATGTVVTAVAQLDRSTGRMLAQAFDRVEDAVLRLQEAKDRVTDSDLKDELEERLERARDQHLSALERARQGLERAQEVVSAAIAEREEAQRRLADVKAKFDDLRQRYEQEASDRNERLPELRTEGTLTYDDAEWLEPSGKFTLTPRINDSDDSVSQTFAWNEQTLAIVPVETREADPSSPAVTVTTARSVALPLNDVKIIIPSGSRVIVQYDPNTEPALATLVTVLPPELPKAIEEALERERLRNISGFITLVEETPDLDAVIGVVIVANPQHDLKIAAKVTDVTEIEIDGEKARFGQLAAGMAVEVEFAVAEADATLAAGTSLAGRLDALRIRARTLVDDNEVHVVGVIAGLDPDTRTVGVLTRDGEVVRARVLNDAVIIKDGTQSRFGALETGDLVLEASRYNRGTLVFTRLVVQSPRAFTFTGTITGLDRDPNRLTIATTDGRRLVAFVTFATRLTREDGSRIPFPELSTGDHIVKGEVRPVQRDGKTVLVAVVLVIGSPEIQTARGVVTRVDADAGELRIRTQHEIFDDGSSSSVLITLFTAENNRSVLFKNDVRIRNLRTVQPGDIVESVSFVTDTRTIIKMSVVSPNLQRVRGVVSAIADGGLSIETSNGRSVKLAIGDETVMTLNGRRIDSLRRVSRGDIVSEAVYIARASDLTNGLALRLTLLDRPFITGQVPSPATGVDEPVMPTVETTISGVIEEISGDEWKIGGRNFTVTPNTRFFGDKPLEGLVAKATLVLNEDDDFVATAISVAGNPDTNPSTRPVEVQPVEPGDAPDEGSLSGLVRILGRVQAVERAGDDSTIVVVDGVKISLVANTVIAGKPEVGAGALAVVRRSSNGTVIAVRIIFTKASDDSGTGSDGDSDGASTGALVSPAVNPDSEDGNDSDSDSSGLNTETIVVEKIAGRIVVSDGRTYLLKVAQVFGLRAGESITLRVRKIDGDRISRELTLLDRFVINGNALYKENSDSGSNPLYVAE